MSLELSWYEKFYCFRINENVVLGTRKWSATNFGKISKDLKVFGKWIKRSFVINSARLKLLLNDQIDKHFIASRPKINLVHNPRNLA